MGLSVIQLTSTWPRAGAFPRWARPLPLLGVVTLIRRSPEGISAGTRKCVRESSVDDSILWWLGILGRLEAPLRVNEAGMAERRLLICDDEPAIGRFVRHVAEGLGFIVETVTDGLAFMRTYQSFEPSTIILDMVMPGLDGNELIAWLAQRNCRAQLIIMTGYHPDYANHARILAEFRGLSPVTTLHKPIDVAKLRAVLAAAPG
ncbi:MAG: response regulator [Defluviicoccus sp.]|nr:response regulator [Defluviicoccus sp.]